MNKAKRLLPLLAFLLIAAAGTSIEQEFSCTAEPVNFAAIFSIFGCSSPAQTQTIGKTAAGNNATETKPSGIVTFIELGSVNCLPCKAMQPVIKAIESRYKGKVNVLFYDVWTDEGAPYAQSFGIQAIPTQVFLDGNKKEFFRHTGFFPESDIDSVLASKGIRP